MDSRGAKRQPLEVEKREQPRRGSGGSQAGMDFKGRTGGMLHTGRRALSEEPRGALSGAGAGQCGRGLSWRRARSRTAPTIPARRVPPSRWPLPVLAASRSSRSLSRPPGACPQVVKRP